MRMSLCDKHRLFTESKLCEVVDVGNGERKWGTSMLDML